MPLRNCTSCHKMFDSLGSEVCPMCVEEDDIAMERARRHARRVATPTVDSLCRASGKSREWVLRQIYNGVLLVSVSDLPCMRCGTVIASGQFCRDCLGSLATDPS